MKNKYFILICIITLLSPLLLYSERSSRLEISSSWQHTYNNTMGHKDELFFHGKHRFSDHLDLNTGFSTAFNALPESFFINMDLKNYPSFLRYRLSLLSRDFPQYEIRENSIYPTISIMTRFVELELGISFRILESDVQIVTTHTLYRLQFNILNNNKYELFLKMSNFNLYRAGNISEIYYTLGNVININDKWGIQADLGLYNPGQVALVSFYSTFFWQLGVKIQL